MSKRLVCPLLLAAVLAAQAAMAAEAAATTDLAPSAWANAASPPDTGTFAVGLGFPDLRARVAWLPRLDVELKAALEVDAQAYSIRTYFRAFRWGRLCLEPGAELGYVRFAGVDNFDGTGYFSEPFLGLRYAFDRHWAADADLGPAFVDVSSGDESVSEWQWTANIAIYYTIF
jgi:hypothetical protein